MQILGMSTMNPDELYHRLGRIVEQAPQLPESGALSLEFMKWAGQVVALIKEVGGDLTLSTRAQNAANGLHSSALDVLDRNTRYQRFLMVLYEALAIAELKAPSSAQGTFIPVGGDHDAFVAIGKILDKAKADVFVVDPYMDAEIIGFMSLAPERVPIRLLCDSFKIQPNLVPAASNWNTQYPKRHVEVRQSTPRMLHDRAIFVDKTIAWTVTQSFKDIAKRSPAEIVRSNDMANLKITAYEQIWNSSKAVVA
jgi:hypothetical protein